MRTLVAITGASGAIYGVQFLKRCPGEKFLIMSRWAKEVLRIESGLSERAVAKLAKRVYPDDDLAAPFASGSNPIDTYAIIPCSVTTMSKIALGICDSLITRAAQVALKERRRLIIALRETPISSIALEHALKLSRDGVIIMPVSPPFYKSPKTVEDVVNAFIDKVLGVIGAAPPDGWRAEELE